LLVKATVEGTPALVVIVTTLVIGAGSASFAVAVPVPNVLLGASVNVTLPVEPVVPEVAESVPAPPGLPAAVEKANGTPCCTGAIVAVRVRAAPPAVNDVELETNDTLVAAVEVTLIVGPP